MKILVKIMCLAVIPLFLTGCKEKTESSKKNISLELHFYKQENIEGLRNIIKAFESSHPGVTIKMLNNPNGDDTEMQKRADIGDLPDIIQMASYSRVKEYASRGLLEDLSKSDFMQKVLQSSLPAVTWNDKLYAVPMDYAGIGIIYNKDIFSRLGIQPPQTMNELETVCSKLKANGISPFAVLLKDNWSMGHFLTMVHTALLREKNINPEQFITEMNAGKRSYGDINTELLFKTMDYYRGNMNSDAAATDGGYQQKLFAEGKAAMMVQGLWAYVDAMKINPGLNAGFIPFPVFNNPKNNVFYADVDSCFAISSQSSDENRLMAYEFMKWLVSSEGQKLWMEQYKLIPPFKGVNVSVFGGPYVDLMSSVEAKGSMPWAFSQYPTEVFDGPCKADGQKYMLKKESAAAVISNIDAQWKAAVSK